MYWDRVLGLALVALLVVLTALAEWSTHLATPLTRTLASTAFIVGCALQLLGHRLEGNRPALLDNLLQILVAPMYLTAELAFSLGLCRDLRTAVQRVSRS